MARHGYIPSKRRERYIDPIDRVIRASRLPSELHAKQIEDTGKPVEVVKVFQNPKPLEHQVLLIVGEVGAGKSTFVDYLQEVALPKEIMDSTTWVRINMNAAPISAGEIYDWIRQSIITGCQANYPNIDFDDLDILQAVFAVQVNQFNKGTGKLYAENQPLYNEKLATVIDKANENVHEKAVALARYCSTQRGKLLIIVLDNSDKRLRDEQLLMFQAAQWIQREFRALVILPIREDTYDNHRNEPPLDTALKDLVFRIEAPLFQHVLMKRVQMTLNAIAADHEKTYRYDLPNGFHVEYAGSDQAFYLSSIVRSIFEYDRHIRRMIVGLAGRNMRRALEIFLEFCTSGHIGEDQIFRIRQNNGQYTLPFFLVMRVLLRLNRRYYDSDHSYVKNLFAAERHDVRPNYFSRLMILRWLRNRFPVAGPLGLKGYFPIAELKQQLIPLGVEEKAVSRELEILLKALCVVTEDLRVTAATDETLIKLAPAGFVHLEMMGSLDYLAAVAEDTWFADDDLARKIAERIRQLDNQYQLHSALANARDLVQYLQNYKATNQLATDVFLDPNSYAALTDLSEATQAIEHFEEATIPREWVEAQKRFLAGNEYDGVIVNNKHFGILVELEPGITGLVHRSKLPRDYETNEQFLSGEEATIRIVNLDPLRRRIDMDYVKSP